MSQAVKRRQGRYLLKWANGQSWRIVAAGQASSWARRFARIIQIKEAAPDKNRRQRRMFLLADCRQRRGRLLLTGLEREIAAGFPRDNWREHEFPPLRFWSRRDLPDIVCEIGNGSSPQDDILKMSLSLDIVYFQTQGAGGLLLHAALIQRRGRAVLLAGPGGSGKSTLCRRLCRPWSALSDDRCLIVSDGAGGYRAHPSPTWSDYLWRGSKRTWDVQRHVRLAAIFFIEQAAKDEVAPIGQAKAAALINQSSADALNLFRWHFSQARQRQIQRQTFNNASELARAVPAYNLRVSRTGRFWEGIEYVL